MTLFPIADANTDVAAVPTMPVTNDPASNSTITIIIIILAVIVGLLIVIIITVILIVVCWRIRKTKTFTPTEHEYSSAYDTIDGMQEVSTKSNQAYSAARLARPRESSDSVGYELTDRKEHSHISNVGQRTVRMESSCDGVCEVMEDNPASDPQTAIPESSGHCMYENMDEDKNVCMPKEAHTGMDTGS